MIGGLEEKIKRFVDKAVFAGKLTLAALAIVYCGRVVGAPAKIYLTPKDLYINYAVDPLKNDQVGDLLNIELVWENIEPNYDDYSTVEILGRTNFLVHNFVHYDDSGSSTKIEHFLDGSSSDCKGYTFLTYAGFIDLVEKHPELSHHLENVRIAAGIISDGRVESLHTWLEVKVNHEWENYETSYDAIREPFEKINLNLLPELYFDVSDGLEYYPWVSFRKLENGSLKRDINYYNVFTYKGNLTKFILRDLEKTLHRELLHRPYTNLVNDLIVIPILTLTGYGISEFRKRPKTKLPRKG